MEDVVPVGMQHAAYQQSDVQRSTTYVTVQYPTEYTVLPPLGGGPALPGRDALFFLRKEALPSERDPCFAKDKSGQVKPCGLPCGSCCCAAGALRPPPMGGAPRGHTKEGARTYIGSGALTPYMGLPPLCSYLPWVPLSVHGRPSPCARAWGPVGATLPLPWRALGGGAPPPGGGAKGSLRMTIPVGSILRYIRARGGGLCVCLAWRPPYGWWPLALTQGTSVGGYLTYLGHVVGRCCARCCATHGGCTCAHPLYGRGGCTSTCTQVLCTVLTTCVTSVYHWYNRGTYSYIPM